MKSHGICDGCYECESYPPEPTGATLAAETAPPVPEDTPETDEARVSRYEAGADPTPRDEAAQATPGQAWHELLNMTEGVRLRRLGDLLTAAGSVMGLTISCEFQADMAAGWKARAEAAEAEVERLTRECLDREATETDARERLRRCEERLAIAQAIAKTATDALPSPTFAQDERWNDGLDGQ